MTSVLAVFVELRHILRLVLLWGAVAIAAIAVIDWMVRTRLVSPFGPVSRFFREHVDPLLEPVERRVVRAGGLPANAPWWALAAVVIGGVLLLAFVDFVGGLLADIARGVSGGTNGIALLLVSWVFAFLRVAILVRVIVSWLPISPFSPWVRWSVTVTEPILRPLRQIIPPIRSIDITPIVLFFALGIVESLVRRLLG